MTQAQQKLKEATTKLAKAHNLLAEKEVNIALTPEEKNSMEAMAEMITVANGIIFGANE